MSGEVRVVKRMYPSELPFSVALAFGRVLPQYAVEQKGYAFRFPLYWPQAGHLLAFSFRR